MSKFSLSEIHQLLASGKSKQKIAPVASAQTKHQKKMEKHRKKQEHHQKALHADLLATLNAARLQSDLSGVDTKTKETLQPLLPKMSGDCKNPAQLSEIRAKLLAGSVPIEAFKAVLRSARQKPLKLWLCPSRTGATSTAGTAQAPVLRIRPSDSLEFTQLAELFDEYKCLESEMLYNVGITISVASIGFDVAVAYDPQDSGAYTSIQGVIVAQIQKLTNVGASETQPAPHTQTGHWIIKAKMPDGTQLVDGGGIGTGTWTSTAITTMDYGYWKAYITAASASVSTQLKAYIKMYVEFRMRT